MLPTFEVLGEWLLVSRRHSYGRGVEVGDLVAYNIPINETVGVKRILGLPGDYVLLDTPGSGSNAMIQVNLSPSSQKKKPVFFSAHSPTARSPKAIAGSWGTTSPLPEIRGYSVLCH